MLKLITLTGFDDNNPIPDLDNIYQENVEFGILISDKKESINRFPSTNWIKNFVKCNFDFSIHICGSIFINNICNNQISKLFNNERFNLLIEKCKRIQINFGNKIKNFNFEENFNQFSDKKIIFQLNDKIYLEKEIFKNKLNILPFLDFSGGNGILPNEWAKTNLYCGYAGGLSVENLEENLKIIDKNNINQYWIDVETGVRTNDVLSVEKCKNFINIAKKFI